MTQKQKKKNKENQLHGITGNLNTAAMAIKVSPSHLNTAAKKLEKLLSIEEAEPSKHLSDQNQHQCGYKDKQ